MNGGRRPGGLRLVGRRSRDARPSLDTEIDVRLAYEAHGGEIYRFALRQTGDEGAWQDIVQEVFLPGVAIGRPVRS